MQLNKADQNRDNSPNKAIISANKLSQQSNKPIKPKDTNKTNQTKENSAQPRTSTERDIAFSKISPANLIIFN